ncbi:MAG: hypothetical protein FRX49_11610 [Trebouxia sp. A1-2]|nr:MAG: hypothetical protein FRX49_11610 [Trebouxia sp. A1-2]
MDLDQEQKEAAAALFTIALHASQVEAGAAGLSQFDSPWGEHAGAAQKEFLSESAPKLDDSAWDAYWGWDCAGPEGLCDRVYQHLKIPRGQWSGLKHLPTASNKDFANSSQTDIIKQKRSQLDKALANLPEPKVVTAGEVAAAAEQVSETQPTADQFASQAGVDDEKDDDLVRDLNRVRSQKQPSPGQQESSSQSKKPLLDSLDELHVSSLSDEHNAQPDAPDASLHELHSKEAESHKPAQSPHKTDDSKSAAHHASSASPPAMSATAVAALTQLLHACLAQQAMPTLQDIMKDRQEKLESSDEASTVQNTNTPTSAAGASGFSSAGSADGSGAARKVEVRWYDARARTALKKVAVWTNVPWTKMSTFECLAAEQAQPPEVKEAQPAEQSHWARNLKIGAAAVAGGTILAVTGGLAAPALAAVAGSVATTIGGSAAAATAVTGMMGSSVGAASMIAGFGYYGGRVTADHMARRIGDVKEFGFRQIPEDGNYASHFSGATDTPKTDSGEAGQTPFSDSRPADSEPDLIDLGQGESKGSGPEDRAAVNQAIADADHASKHSHHPHLHHRGQEQQHVQDRQQPGEAPGSPSKQGTGSSFGGLFGGGGSKAQGVEVEPLLPIPVATEKRPDPRLALTIGVAGWIADPKDFVDMWRPLGCADSERFALVWESEELKALNNTLFSFIKNKVTVEAGKYLVEQFVVQGLVAAVALPMTVMSAANLIDTWWAVCLDRAEKAGKLLAHVLMSGAHGDRPVTLIGYSMGARLVYHCLLELCRFNCKGIVEHAVMLGCTVTIVKERFTMARSVVSGRFVNAYSSQDWLLGLLFRSTSGFIRPAAGLCPVDVAGVENADLTDVVKGHFDYIKKMDIIVKQLGFGPEAAEMQ